MKIGIISLYYKNLNYGGNLQAYALCKYLQNHGMSAEQIQFQHSTMSYMTFYEKLKKIGIYEIAKKIFPKIGIGRENEEIKRIKEIREESFKEFSQNVIPHSKNIYSVSTIFECNEYYDVFITGSDQVWNFDWYNSAYFLDFVNSDKKKNAYAASFSMDKLSDKQKDIVKKSLKCFSGISVREQRAVELLGEVIDDKISLVLDPTLLLDAKEWEQISPEKIFEDKYVFAYFLGNNITFKEMLTKFSKKRGYKIAFIPYAGGDFSKRRDEFGDIKKLDASPLDFLSLIKHAEYIFTDSFHAVVFSFIFKKQFFVFNRDAKGSMNSRIISLTDMFDMQERFCATKEQEQLEYIESLKPIDYNRDFPKFEECRERSYEFIRKNILEED